jgi:hypothetical protein
MVPGSSSQVPQEKILFVGFNQDQGCFTVGTNNGFRIFNTFPFKDTFHRGNFFYLRFKILEFEGGIGYIELLYRTNIMALVGGGDKPKWLPNKVMIWDDSQMKVIGEINFKKQIRGVKMR